MSTPSAAPAPAVILCDPGVIHAGTFLDAWSISSMMRCSRHWHTLIGNGDNQLWRTIYSYHYPSLYEKTMSGLAKKRNDRQRVIAWKTLYMGQYRRVVANKEMDPRATKFFALIRSRQSLEWTVTESDQLLSLLPKEPITYGSGSYAHVSLSLATLIPRTTTALIHYIIQHGYEQHLVDYLFVATKFRRHFAMVMTLANDDLLIPLFHAVSRCRWKLFEMMVSLGCSYTMMSRTRFNNNVAVRSLLHLAASNSVIGCRLFVRPVRGHTTSSSSSGSTATNEEKKKTDGPAPYPIPVDTVDASGLTPFLVACMSTRVEIMNYLIECGANPRYIATIPISLRTPDYMYGFGFEGCTALSCAITNPHYVLSDRYKAWQWCLARGLKVDDTHGDVSVGSSYGIMRYLFLEPSPYEPDGEAQRSLLRMYDDLKHRIDCDWKRVINMLPPAAPVYDAKKMDYLVSMYEPLYSRRRQSPRMLWLLQHGAAIPSATYTSPAHDCLAFHDPAIYWWGHPLHYVVSWPAWQAAIHNGLDLKTWWRPLNPRAARPDEPCGGPLHIAVRYATPEAVEQLILAGCDVNQMDDYGRTPLACLMEVSLERLSQWPHHTVTVKGSVQTLRILIRHGASVTRVARRDGNDLNVEQWRHQTNMPANVRWTTFIHAIQHSLPLPVPWPHICSSYDD